MLQYLRRIYCSFGTTNSKKIFVLYPNRQVLWFESTSSTTESIVVFDMPENKIKIVNALSQTNGIDVPESQVYLVEIKTNNSFQIEEESDRIITLSSAI
jgi:hypothetical protein